MDNKNVLFIAAIFAAIGVGMGALGAHAFKEVLSPDQLTSYLTGTRYQMYHAIALVGIVGASGYLDKKWSNFAIWSMIIGIILFSGSIYFLATKDLTGISFSKVLGPITPLGGLFLIFSWVFIGISALKKGK